LARVRWLGPAIVIGGLAIGGIAVWYWRHAQPVAGDLVHAGRCRNPGGDSGFVAIRSERDGDRSFVEMHARGSDGVDRVIWQALIPHYAGSRDRTAFACGKAALTVRVERGGRAEVFGFELGSGEKIGGYRLASEHEPIRVEPTGPITLSDGERSYEIVGGPGWHQLIAVDLATGRGLWKVDLGADPVDDGRVENGQVSIRQGVRQRSFTPEQGREAPVTWSDKPPY
jgi:hypothetical protein